MERKLFQEEHHLLRKTLGEFIEQKVLPEYPKWEKEGLVPKKMWLDAGEMGWLCPTAKQEYGGLGAELLHSVVIAEELACLLYTSPSPRDRQKYRMPSSA